MNSWISCSMNVTFADIFEVCMLLFISLQIFIFSLSVFYFTSFSFFPTPTSYSYFPFIFLYFLSFASSTCKTECTATWKLLFRFPLFSGWSPVMAWTLHERLALAQNFSIFLSHVQLDQYIIQFFRKIFTFFIWLYLLHH